MREVVTCRKYDPDHPTKIFVIKESRTHDVARTDKRESEKYVIEQDGVAFVEIAFHEGRPPSEGLNGLLVEDLIAICLDRFEQHNNGPFRCRENSLVITKLEEAILWNMWRRLRRKFEGTSGTQLVRPETPAATDLDRKKLLAALDAESKT